MSAPRDLTDIFDNSMAIGLRARSGISYNDQQISTQG